MSALRGSSARLELARALVDLGAARRREATHGRDALTPSELRVAELAAAGRTNRQIAQALFVTQRTVENHLTSAYDKLVITARSELAGALATAPPSGTPPRYNHLPSRAIAPPVGAA